jgi:YegS/Rv2252/BmrU family lipid kinase
MKNYFVIVNPMSGFKKGLDILEKVRPVFIEQGASMEVIETQYAGHAQQILLQLPFQNYTAVCIIGGDGTMHEVINGMLKRADKQQIPLGLIPGGTGNAFMNDLNCLDPIVAVKRILLNHPREVDIAQVNANGVLYYSFNIVGWGLPTDINILAEKMRFFGKHRYNIASIIEVLKHTRRLAKINIDGQTIAGDYGFILGCNTIHTGNKMQIAPLASINDGLFDLLIVRKAGRLKLLSLFPLIFSGGHVGDAAVLYHQVKEFSILPLTENHSLNIDGEIVGNTPVHVKVLPNHIQVLV